MTTAPCTEETCTAILPGDQEVYNAFYPGACNTIFTREWAFWFTDTGYEDYSTWEPGDATEDFEHMVAITASRTVVAPACSLV